MAAILLLFRHLGHGGQLLKRAFPSDFQVCTQNAGVVHNHPLLNVAVLQDVQDVMADKAQRFPALGVSLKQFKIFRFRTPVGTIVQRRRPRIPLSTLLKPVIGLRGKKIGIEDMPQLMGEQPADLLIPGLPGLVHGHTGMAGVDPDQAVVRAGTARFLRLPDNTDLDPPPVAVTPGLGGGNILKVGGQGPRRKKLPVSDGLLLLRDKLLDFFMVHSCQE